DSEHDRRRARARHARVGPEDGRRPDLEAGHLHQVAPHAERARGAGAVNPMFSPAGPAAHTLALLGWFILILFAVITVVMWALLWLVISRRQGTLEEHAPWNAPGDLTWVGAGGFIAPSIILGVIFIVALVAMSAVP